ncbi:MAG: hypothetical protein GF307_07470 [candidate division Zixibacteria bacterium]|nr:hypothetical protein [candidate division Zixibacteria bacterium]
MKLKFIVVIALIACVLSVGLVQAQDSTGGIFKSEKNIDSQKQNPAKLETSSFGLIIRLLLSLAIICLVIYFSIWGLKRLSNARWGRANSNSNIEIIDNSFMGPKKGLHVVRAGSKYLLVASSDTSMNFICELNPEDFKNVSNSTAMSKAPNGKFKDILDKLRLNVERNLLGKAGNVEV